MWRELYGQLVDGEIKRPPLDEIESAFRDCEEKLDFDFPASFRAFVEQFGPGELLGWFRVYTPIIKGVPKSRQLDIVEQHQMWRDPDGFFASTAEPELVNRLVFCCDTVGGDAYFWDSSDITCRSTSEYAIYELPHSGAGLDGKVTRVADGFDNFINVFCLTTTWPDLACDDQKQEYWPLWPRV